MIAPMMIALMMPLAVNVVSSPDAGCFAHPKTRPMFSPPDGAGKRAGALG
jgi:hypothetical protein